MFSIYARVHFFEKVQSTSYKLTHLFKLFLTDTGMKKNFPKFVIGKPQRIFGNCWNFYYIIRSSCTLSWFFFTLSFHLIEKASFKGDQWNAEKINLSLSGNEFRLLKKSHNEPEASENTNDQLYCLSKVHDWNLMTEAIVTTLL